MQQIQETQEKINTTDDNNLYTAEDSNQKA